MPERHPWNIKKNQLFKMTFAVDFKARTVQFGQRTPWRPPYFTCGPHACSEMLRLFTNIYQTRWCMKTWTYSVQYSLKQDSQSAVRFASFKLGTKFHVSIFSLPSKAWKRRKELKHELFQFFEPIHSKDLVHHYNKPFGRSLLKFWDWPNDQNRYNKSSSPINSRQLFNSPIV